MNTFERILRINRPFIIDRSGRREVRKRVHTGLFLG